MQIKTTMRYYLIPVRMPSLKSLRIINAGEVMEKKGTLLHCWWECKLLQPLWKTVWRLLTKVELVFDPEIPQSSSVQFSSLTQSCPTLCNPMDCSTPGVPVHHQLPEFTQTHVHRVSDAIQPSHPLLSPSLPAFNLSQHQGLFQ